MRFSLALFAAIAFSTSLPAGEPAAFHQPAVVAVDAAEVRCGPDRQNYQTAKLPRGTKVEVYHRAPGGWMAIRPPEGSFSWVQRNQVQKVEGSDLARVVDDQAVAWIGSQLGTPTEYKWQVQLRRDETVVLLDNESMPGGRQPEQWYKIAPPAGEFRWIHQDQVDTPLAARSAVTTTDDQLVKPANFEPEPSQPAATSPSPTTTVAGDVVGLQVELSKMVAGDVEHWNLASLRRRALQLQQQAAAADLRRDTEQLLASVDRFENWQARHAALQDTPTMIAGRADEEVQTTSLEQPGALEQPGLLSELGHTIGSGVKPLTAGEEEPYHDSLYDARGWLMPVHSRTRTAPPYALLDRDGNVIAYVTGAPGLNLHRYRQQEVGVLGAKQYHASLKSDHIMARRIVDLRRHR